MPGNWARAGQTTTPLKRNAATEDEQAEEKPMFVAEQPRRTLDDLVVPSSVLRRLDAAVAVIEHRETLFVSWNLRKIDPYRDGTAVNFYGPSGTGKSLAAEALAHRLGRPFIRVDYSEIESRYVGETSKNITRCFAAADKQKAVLIFDEADSILGSRLTGVTHSADHSVNVSRAVMLSQLDRFAGLVVFTSNIPKNYDAAFLRRIVAHVHFEHPDEETLNRLWELLLPPELPKAAEVTTSTLAEETTGLAGGDLVNVIIAAATRAVTRTSDERVVTMADLRAEIAAVRTARDHVGKPFPSIRALE